MITLDRPVIWQKATNTVDAYGQQKRTWESHKTVWAKLMPLRGYENIEAMQKVATGNIRFVVRYDIGWQAADRLLVDGKITEITSVQEYHPSQAENPNTREHYLMLDCTDRDSENTGRDA
jgi:SPP1 family predicted phage head-tail adaptor